MTDCTTSFKSAPKNCRRRCWSNFPSGRRNLERGHVYHSYKEPVLIDRHHAPLCISQMPCGHLVIFLTQTLVVSIQWDYDVQAAAIEFVQCLLELSNFHLVSQQGGLGHGIPVRCLREMERQFRLENQHSTPRYRNPQGGRWWKAQQIFPSCKRSHSAIQSCSIWSHNTLHHSILWQ